MPPIAPLVAFVLWLGGVVSYIMAALGQCVFGVWKPSYSPAIGASVEKDGEGTGFPGDRDDLYETPEASPSTERKER